MAARPITITVKNSTGQKLLYKNSSMTHGKFPTDPTDVDDKGQIAFTATEMAWAMIGPEGVVRWQGAQTSGAFIISFVHPYGTGTTDVNPSEPQGWASEITDDKLQQHDASCTVTWSTF
ncbi:MAG: hypothetical protein AUI14_26455 [Actinobacteria bacterium 13_2_20CM_2_71_6]|nr:MAG: hypothetical protein AUI14_26455 [Actinobacteria bacterium 13_2_20CM_2_71_6]